MEVSAKVADESYLGTNSITIVENEKAARKMQQENLQEFETGDMYKEEDDEEDKEENGKTEEPTEEASG